MATIAYAPRHRLWTPATAVKIAVASSRAWCAGALQLQRKHVQQHFRIGIGIDVTKVELKKLALQRLAVGQIAVVGKRDAERRVDVERLRLELR
jgi:hypothetical protein